MFAQQELDSGWVLLFIDRWHRSNPSARLFNQTCSIRLLIPLPLACKCELEHFRSVRGVRLLHGAYFEGERGRTRLYCGMSLLFATTAVRSPHGMSVQPDILILFSMPPPSWDGGFLPSSACCFFVSRKDWTGRVSGSHTLPRVCSTRSAISFFSRPPSSAKATRKLFQFRSFAVYLTFAARWGVLIHAWCATPACSLREGRTR